LLEFFAGHPKTRLLGSDTTGNRAPTVSVSTLDQTPAELAKKLADEKLGVGVGHFYAYRLIEALGINTDEGVLRASFVHYTTEEEVNRLIGALDQHL